MHLQGHPVVDLTNQAPVDAYEIPDGHRHAVHLMTPADVFPLRLEHLTVDTSSTTGTRQLSNAA